MDALNNAWDDIVNALGQNHVPEIFLVAIGLLVIVLAATYVKDDESYWYKGFYVISFIVAAITVVLVATKALPIEFGPLVILALGCFTLLSRPFRESHMAVILGLFILVIAYLGLSTITDVDLLKDFWVRFILALIIAGIVYAVASFIENIVELFGKLLNWWPMMFVIGILCLAEAVLIYTNNGSIVTWIMHAFGK